MLKRKLKYDKIKNCFAFAFGGFLVLASVIGCLSLNVSAASSGGSPSDNFISEYPLPFGEGSSMGYDSSVLDIPSLVSAISSTIGNRYLLSILVLEYYASTNSVVVGVGYSWSGTDTGGYISVGNSSDYPSFGRTSVTFNRESGNSYLVNLNDYSVQQGYTFEGAFTPSSYVQPLPNGNVALPKNTWFYNYPVFLSENWDLSYNGDIYFTRDFDSDSDGGSGNSVSGSGEGNVSPDGNNGFDLDFRVDLDLDLTGILDKLDIIIANQEEYGGLLGLIAGKLDSMLGKLDSLIFKLDILSNAIFDNQGSATDTTTETQIITAILGNQVTGYFLNATQDLQQLGSVLTTDSSSMLPVEWPDVEFTFHWQLPFHPPHTHIPTTFDFPVRLSFSWYDNIRSRVLPVILAFLYMGWILYAFRQIPSVISGLSGGASAGISVADAFQNGHRLSRGHTNSGKESS